MCQLRALILSTVAMAFAVNATDTLASSLVKIPPYEGPAITGGGTFVGSATEGRAVAPDGRYIVGLCSGQDDNGPVTLGFIWDGTSADSRHILSSDNALADGATGVGYRNVNGTQQVVVFGTSAGGWPTNWFADDVGLAGLSWIPKLRDLSLEVTISVSNTMAGTVTSDIWYNTMVRASDDLAAFIEEGSGDPPDKVRTIKSSPSPQRMSARGISATGRAVGTRRDTDGTSTNRRNMYLDYIDPLSSPAQTFFKSLDGVSQRGEAWSVSADGDRIFGLSPLVVDGTDFYPYMYTVSTDTIEELPIFPDTAGSVSLGVPYGASADGNYAVGQSYRGLEKAVLWDVSDPDPANWQVFDLTDFFEAAEGLGEFTRLNRAFSVGVTDGGDIVITGIGITAEGVQGFVATLTELPPPTGACCIENLGFRTCEVTFEDDCEGTFTPNTSCANVDCPTCNTPFADADFDGDVDQFDFGVFQRCITASGQPYLPGCDCFDRNDGVASGTPDGSVTIDDFGDFLLCTTGPSIPFDEQNPPAGCNP